MNKKHMEKLQQKPVEIRKQPLAPEQYRANNLAVYGEVKMRSELDPANPEYLRLSPLALRALEIYTTEISLIPRGPGNKMGMIGYFSDYTDRFNANPEFHQTLSYHVDKAGNVSMQLAAHGGQQYEETADINIQGHYDIVSAADEGFREPAEAGVALQLQEIPDRKTGRNVTWMSGIGTSAGIDCAWGVAWGMAYLESVARENRNHPVIRAIITADEEIGLLGAKAFSFTNEQLLSNRPVPKEWYLLNIDNENLNGLVGSAGILGSEVSLPTERETMPQGFTRLALDISGTQAGHSGDERDRVGNGRWNKITEAATMLEEIRQLDGLENVRLIAIGGGHADNAIPMQVKTFVLAIPEGKEEEVLAHMQQMAEVKNEQAVVDLERFSHERPERAEDDEADVITIKQVAETEKTLSLQPMTNKATRETLALLDALNPDGVLKIEWDPNDPEAVETSSNLSIVTTDEEGVHITIMSRSSQKDQLGDTGIRATAIRSAVTALGATYADDPNQSEDPWEPDFTDPIIGLQQEAAKKVLPPEKKFKVTTIHAGVEIKTLRDKLRELFGPDFVLHATSNGPKYKGAHSFQERGPIESMEDFAQFEAALVDEVIAYELAKSQEESLRRRAA